MNKFLTVFFGVLIVFLTSGVIFGFAPLQDVLISEGAFSYLCDNENDQCDKQAHRFVFLFTISSSAFNITSFLSGLFLDKYGPRYCYYLGCVIFATGLLILGLTSNIYIKNETLGYLSGFLLVGSGGPFIFQSFLHVSCLYPNYKGLITTAIVSALEGSCIVFALFNFLYFNYDIVSSTSFYYYSIFTLIVGVLYLQPKEKFTMELSVNNDYHDLIEESPQQRASSINDSSYIQHQEDIKEELKNQDFWKQVTHKWYYSFFCLYMISGLYRVNYFTSSLEIFLSSKIQDDDVVKDYISYFGWILPVVGILVVPIVGKALDTLKLQYNLIYLSIIGLLMNITCFFHNITYQIITFTLMAIFRAALFSILCSFLTYKFGYNNYGSLLGLSLCFTGIIQFTFDPLTVYIQDHGFYNINIIFTIIAIIRFIFPIMVYKDEKYFNLSVSSYQNNVRDSFRSLNNN